MQAFIIKSSAEQHRERSAADKKKAVNKTAFKNI